MLHKHLQQKKRTSDRGTTSTHQKQPDAALAPMRCGRLEDSHHWLRSPLRGPEFQPEPRLQRRFSPEEGKRKHHHQHQHQHEGGRMISSIIYSNYLFLGSVTKYQQNNIALMRSSFPVNHLKVSLSACYYAIALATLLLFVLCLSNFIEAHQHQMKQRGPIILQRQRLWQSVSMSRGARSRRSSYGQQHEPEWSLPQSPPPVGQVDGANEQQRPLLEADLADDLSVSAQEKIQMEESRLVPFVSPAEGRPMTPSALNTSARYRLIDANGSRGTADGRAEPTWGSRMSSPAAGTVEHTNKLNGSHHHRMKQQQQQQQQQTNRNNNELSFRQATPDESSARQQSRSAGITSSTQEPRTSEIALDSQWIPIRTTGRRDQRPGDKPSDKPVRLDLGSSTTPPQQASSQATSALLDYPAHMQQPTSAPATRQQQQTPKPKRRLVQHHNQVPRSTHREPQQALDSQAHGTRHHYNQHPVYDPAAATAAIPTFNSYHQPQQAYEHHHHMHHHHHHIWPQPRHAPPPPHHYHHRRPRFQGESLLDNNELGPAPPLPPPLMRPNKIYKRVLLCDKTLVSLDYVRNLDMEPRPVGLGGGLNEHEINEINDNFLDLEGHFDSSMARSSGSLAAPEVSSNATARPTSSRGGNSTTPRSSSSSSSNNNNNQSDRLASNETTASLESRRSYHFGYGGSASAPLLNDQDPLVRCDMWDLEKGLKSRKPPEHILRMAVKADFDTVRDAINRCRQLSEKTLPPDDEYRDGLEIMSTEDLVSLFSVKRGLMPGTKWCGLGDQADQYNDLGPKHRIDICCRAHDHCPIRSKPFRNDYGVLNIGLYTKSHCDCDADFYRCLREVRSRTADMLGNLYFNVMKLQCMREERLKVCREMKPIALGFERCVRYEDSPMKTVFKFTTPPVSY